MNTLKKYILNCLASGTYFFTKQEAMTALELNENQFRFQAYRLIQKKLIQRLIPNFYMIISAEYQHFGAIPSQWIIDPLMKHLSQEYYIGLLSAATFYGATEQQPMLFQVITNKKMNPIHLERTNIEFYVRKNCTNVPTTTITTQTGYAKISTKEQTMIDLIKFYTSCGSLSNVALIIKSLAEECTPESLAHVIAHEKTNPLLQRLGYIFDLTELPHFAAVVELELSKRQFRPTLLIPHLHIKTGAKATRWRLILNDVLELS